MKINKILIISMVIISLFAISAVSAAEDIAISQADELQAIEDVNQDAEEVLLQDVDDENVASNVEDEDVVSDVDEDDVLSDGASPVGDKENITQEITVKVDGKELNTFNYTYVNGSFDFKDLLEKMNMSGQADFNMSKFGNFSQMFNMFNDVNFAQLNKTFNFKISGDVGDIKYGLKVISDDVNFIFDYNMTCPDGTNTTPVADAKKIEIFAGNALLANLTIVNGNTDFDFSQMMKMFDMSGFDMSSFGNFKDMMGMFENINYTGNNSMSNNKTFDFKINGLVRNIAYSLSVLSNLTDFVFDYHVTAPTVSSTLTANDLTTSTVNTALDGETGGYLTVTLKDSFGKGIPNKTLSIVIDGKVTNIKTDNNGVAKYQVNFANAGTYYATIFFLGDDTAKSSTVTVKVTVVKQKTTVKTNKNKYTFKRKAKKKVKVTLKNANGKAIKGKQITLKIKNKTFKAKTNAKGTATITVKFTKKGKYTVTTKFAGDNTYNSASKKVKVTIK